MRNLTMLALMLATPALCQIVSSDSDYKPEVNRIVRESPVFKGHITKAWSWSGSLFMTLDQSATRAVALTDCDTQRDVVSAIGNKWIDLIGKDKFVSVEVRSYTGRKILEVEKTVFSGLKYHCD